MEKRLSPHGARLDKKFLESECKVWNDVIKERDEKVSLVDRKRNTSMFA